MYEGLPDALFGGQGYFFLSDGIKNSLDFIFTHYSFLYLCGKRGI